jgi:two-component system response regulator FixJ
LQEELIRRQIGLPVIIVTGHGDVPLAVRAMKAGAVDFIEKPFDEQLMLDSVGRAIEVSSQSRSQASLTQAAESRIALLTARERQVLEHLVAGRANKVIAHELNISPRTVEIHRAHLMEKMQARSLSELVRLALAAGVVPAQSKDPRR